MKLIKIFNIKVLSFNILFKLNNKNFIKNFKIIIENYNKFTKKNSILICHALTSSHHIGGVYIKNLKNIGWWNNLLSNNIIFKKSFNILCINNLSSCYGSTNPKNKNPFTNKAYEFNFPKLNLIDWIKIQKYTINKIKIKHIFLLIGGSLGGLQIIIWSIIYPGISKFYICIASTLKLSLSNKIYNEISRLSINNDHKFYKNYYYNYKIISIKGLKLSRIIGHITYLSKFDLKQKIKNFLYKKSYKLIKNKFNISNYLYYQGNKFIKYFEVNSYLSIMKILNKINIKKFKNKILININNILNFLIITFKKDKRFTYNSSFKIFKFMLKFNKKINYKIINILSGHDSFLMNKKNYLNLINIFINKYILSE